MSGVQCADGGISQLESFLSVMFGPPHEWKENLCQTGGLERRLKACGSYQNGCFLVLTSSVYQDDLKSPIEPWFTQKVARLLRSHYSV